MVESIRSSDRSLGPVLSALCRIEYPSRSSFERPMTAFSRHARLEELLYSQDSPPESDIELLLNYQRSCKEQVSQYSALRIPILHHRALNNGTWYNPKLFCKARLFHTKFAES